MWVFPSRLGRSIQDQGRLLWRKKYVTLRWKAWIGLGYVEPESKEKMQLFWTEEACDGGTEA